MEPKDRLRQARERRGFASPTEAATAFGWNPVTYRAHENGGRDLSRQAAVKYGDAFRVSAGWLLYGDRTQKQEATVISVPVRGNTACGLWAENGSFEDEEYPPIPAVPTMYKNAEQFAFKVVGSCMDKLRIADGDYVVCVPYWVARAAISHSDIIVCERRRAHLVERTCKQVVVTPEGVELWPRSHDVRYAAPIKLNRDLSPVEDGIEVEIVGLVIGRYAPV